MKELADKVKADVNKRMESLGDSRTATDDEVALCALICRIEELEEKLGAAEDRCVWLDALNAAGVDNWDGCSEAQDIMEEWENM